VSEVFPWNKTRVVFQRADRTFRHPEAILIWRMEPSDQLGGKSRTIVFSEAQNGVGHRGRRGDTGRDNLQAQKGVLVVPLVGFFQVFRVSVIPRQLYPALDYLS
jgi:hypothetical protein